MRGTTWNRRQALGAAASSAAGVFTIVPRRVLGGRGYVPPSDTITLAGVGVGGVGHPHLAEAAAAGFEIVALCDIDSEYARKAFDTYPQARTYQDFRELLASEADKVDAVYCGTPDHTHAIVTLPALRARKHVCCVKPLTRTLEECRAVVAAAQTAGTATQVTAAPHTTDQGCTTIEAIAAGAIGDVIEVHVWSDRPLWPQGMTRPDGEDPVPATFDWKAWIGPAPMRPYRHVWPANSLTVAQLGSRGAGPFVYHPWNFRGWWDFGTGALGDMGCHHLNTVYKALELTRPERVEATAVPRIVNAESAPLGSIVTYEFPARGVWKPVRVVWYDGGLKPPTPVVMGPDFQLPGSGEMYVGTDGVMLNNRIYPASQAQKVGQIPRTLVRRGSTFGEWMVACRGGEEAGCAFDWAGLLTEFVLLGNIAIRTGDRLTVDPASGQIVGNDRAEALSRADYQNGWTLDG